MFSHSDRHPAETMPEGTLVKAIATMRQAAWILILLSILAAPLRAQTPPVAVANPSGQSAAVSNAAVPTSSTANLTPPLPWRQNVFSIPFQVSAPPGSPNAPAEVQLYLSVDQGQSWRLAQRVPPQAGKFTFRAPSDGEYWFAMRTLGANGLFLDNQALSPGLRVLVDTTAPTLELRGQRGKSGEVELHWQIADAALDARTLKLEYQSAHDASWRALSIGAMQPGQIPGSSAGSASFWNGQGVGLVSIRAEVSDIAGNRTVSQKKIALDDATANAVANANSPAPVNPAGQQNQSSPSQNSTAPKYPPVAQQFPKSGQAANAGQLPPAGQLNQTQNPFQQRPAVNANAATVPTGNAAYGSQQQFGSGQPAGAGQGTPIPGQAQAGLPGWGVAGTPSSHGTPLAGNGATPNVPPGTADDIFLSQPPTAQAWPADRVAQVPLEQSGPLSAGGERYFAQRSPTQAPGGEAYAGNYPAQQPPTQQPFQQQPSPPQSDPNSPYQTISQQREGLPAYNGSIPAAVTPLPFELPRGAKLRMVNSPAFELQYDLSTVEPNSVAKVELWGTRDGGKSWALFGEDPDRQSPVPAEVKGDGIYGFSIVVHANTGQSSPTPQPGTLPEVWVGVDATPPTATLLAAEAGENDINIRWTSSDAYPAAKPVTLSYAATPQGPWTQISTAQHSQGAYTWQPGRSVPELVFIQVQVIDEAGNISTAVSQQNVALPHHRPQGRILNVQPVGQ